MKPLSFAPRHKAWLLALSLAGLNTFAHATPPDEGSFARHGAPAHAMRQLDAVKARLQLSAAQEEAWGRFAAAIRTRPTPQTESHADHEELMRLPTPQRIERMNALRTARQAHMLAVMGQRNQATLAFYATLSPEQQKVFDDETARLLRERHLRHPRHGGRGGHHSHG